ncbi:hypothetical protein TNIN_389601 [Trichonephila inaurata madagascariensis]|uniref:Uncharacterized protein n=1 Tax=Trichonephila inaurata madagascariensis TaxID=2747483 RepID=A0A8X6X5D4_9ARAC|nr:hypothetical protein TNIN_389601 [Trichonephila inaurata madagascariensis]
MDLTIDVLESVEIPERESKKDETSKNNSNLNRNATKDTRQIMQNQMNYAESDSDTSAVEDYSLAHTSEHVTSKSDQHMGRKNPKKRPLTKKDIESSVKKMKTKNSDSSSQVPCIVADVSKKVPKAGRIYPGNEMVSYAKSAKKSLTEKNREIIDYSSDSSSEESAVDEEVSRRTGDSSADERQTEHKSNLLKWLISDLMEGSTSTAREASRQEMPACYPKRRIAPTFIRSLREEPVQSPVTTIVTDEEAVRESNRDVLNIHGRMITSEFTKETLQYQKQQLLYQKSLHTKQKEKRLL